MEKYDDYLAFYPWKLFDKSDGNEFDLKISDECYHDASREVIDEINKIIQQE
ncbi:hypothetical protein [Oribacterium sp. NK2B42]|uniref:hypothetical protein n=1 Tax=Oribacterium sp. NK2B42 TaxID=689781 RepID=UPI0004293066|nr:hypothetical protein [Oribacterium sp. NK2B42]